uniref:Methylated-DNA-[protein]-cysteine S-methyltransferase DNA binding domain-containing protein n=1 Tax=uncultured marine thaumarchaeote KM3_61_F08 TaxID=1456214 RepID=A0A075H9P7_9ARCH|nr:hypothetical protein [uncultured marine thaumarchaeote KM3_61_F08]
MLCTAPSTGPLHSDYVPNRRCRATLHNNVRFRGGSCRPTERTRQACGANPIPIIIPCHRVVAANGLGGYSGAGGIETKVELLRLEGAYSLLI